MMKVIKIFATIAIIICVFLVGRMSLPIEDYITGRSLYPTPVDDRSKRCIQNLKKLNTDMYYYQERFAKLITLGTIYDSTAQYNAVTRIGDNGLDSEENLSSNTYCPDAYGKLDNMQKKVLLSIRKYQ